MHFHTFALLKVAIPAFFPPISQLSFKGTSYALQSQLSNSLDKYASIPCLGYHEASSLVQLPRSCLQEGPSFFNHGSPVETGTRQLTTQFPVCKMWVTHADLADAAAPAADLAEPAAADFAGSESVMPSFASPVRHATVRKPQGNLTTQGALEGMSLQMTQ